MYFDEHLENSTLNNLTESINNVSYFDSTLNNLEMPADNKSLDYNNIFSTRTVVIPFLVVPCVVGILGIIYIKNVRPTEADRGIAMNRGFV